MAEGNVEATESIRIVRRMFEAWNRGDYAAAREAIDPEVRVEMSTDSVVDGTYEGMDGIAELMGFWGAFGDFRSEIREAFTAGADVVTTIHHFGRGKASGIEVEMENWQVFTVRDGRLTRWRIYGSRERALEAAGVSS